MELQTIHNPVHRRISFSIHSQAESHTENFTIKFSSNYHDRCKKVYTLVGNSAHHWNVHSHPSKPIQTEDVSISATFKG